MLISFNSLLRRNRRRVALALAVLGLSFAGLAAHSALMGSDTVSTMSTAAVCVAIGGCVAVVVAGFAMRRLAQRPRWLIPAPPDPALPFVPVSLGFLVRAGPPSLSQVFRL
jgi:hypothetical protein